MQYMFIISETIVNISMKTRHVSKIIEVFQRTCSCIVVMKKKEHQFPLLLFLCTEQFTNRFTFSHDRAALLLNRKMYSYYLLLHLFASLCTHTVF